MRPIRFRISSRAAFTAIFLAYAVALEPFLDTLLRNYLVIVAALFGTLGIVAFRLNVARDLLVSSILFAYMMVVGLTSSGSSDLPSALFTIVFALGYVAMAGFTGKPWFDNRQILRLFGLIIKAFAVVSLVQMAASLLNLPIPNLIASKGLWSYNSLAFEPSQLGRVLGITMLAYLIVARMDRPKATLPEILLNHWTVVSAFVLTMLLSGSALAAAAIIMVFLLSSSVYWIAPTGFILILAWPLATEIEYEPLQRAIRFLLSLPSLDIDTIFRAEGSGALRVIPALIYIDRSNPNEIGWWLGHGSSGLTNYFLGEIPSLRQAASAGFFPGFAVFYGVVGFGLFLWTYVLRFVDWTTAPIILFWIIFFLSVAWNIQFLWYGLIVLRIVHELNKQNDKLEPAR